MHKKKKKTMNLIIVLLLITMISCNFYPVQAKEDSVTLTIHCFDWTMYSRENPDAEPSISTGEADIAWDEGKDKFALANVGVSLIKLANLGVNEMDTESAQSSIHAKYQLQPDMKEILFPGSSKSLFTADEIRAVLPEKTNELEKYAWDNKNDPEIVFANCTTDKNGTAILTIDRKDYGLFLAVETAVPENVNTITNTFVLSLPMVNANGTGWNYDVHIYPKNETSIPDVRKLVKGTNDKTYEDSSTVTPGDIIYYNLIGAIPKATTEVTKLNKFEFHDNIPTGFECDITYVNGKYVLKDPESVIVRIYDNRGDANQVTSNSYIQLEYGEDKDYTVDYIYSGNTQAKKSETTRKYVAHRSMTKMSIVQDPVALLQQCAESAFNSCLKATSFAIPSGVNSKIQKISQAYNRFESRAKVTTQQVNESSAPQGSSSIIINLTEKGLQKLNAYADGSHFLSISYPVIVGDTDQIAVGDDGNRSDVTLTYGRTASTVSQTTGIVELEEQQLQDAAIVLTYGFDMQKKFEEAPDQKAGMDQVNFIIQNKTSSKYLIGELRNSGEAGNYKITSSTDNKDEATVFYPGAEGELIIDGVAAEEYLVTETKTVKGFAVLDEPVDINIVPKAFQTQPTTAIETAQEQQVSTVGVSSVKGQEKATATVNGQPAEIDENGRVPRIKLTILNKKENIANTISNVLPKPGNNPIVNAAKKLLPKTGDPLHIAAVIAGSLVALFVIILCIRKLLTHEK